MKKVGDSNFYFFTDEDQIRKLYKNEWVQGNNSISIDSSNVKKFSKDKDGKYYLLVPDASLIQDIDLTKTYKDFIFEISSPFVIKNKELSTFSNVGPASKLEITNKINFYNSEYNKLAKDYNDELNLLNYYLLISKDIRDNPDIENIVTNGYQIDDFLFDKKTINTFYSNYVKTFEKWKDVFDKKYKDKLKTIAFNPKDVPYSEVTAELFPNYTSVDFYKYASGDFISAIDETYYGLNFLSKMVEIGSSDSSPALPFNKLKRYIHPYFDVESATGSVDIVASLTTNNSIKYFDYTEWLENILKNSADINNNRYFDFSQNSNAFYIGNKTNDSLPATGDNVFLSNLLSRILLGKSTFITSKNTRNWYEILSGKDCYTEVVGIKIEKEKKGVGVVQTYYFENTKEDLLKFIDTQIIDAEEYQYNTYYYVLAIGNQYKYSLGSIDNKGKKQKNNQATLQDTINPPQIVIQSNNQLQTTSQFTVIQQNTSPSSLETLKTLEQVGLNKLSRLVPSTAKQTQDTNLGIKAAAIQPTILEVTTKQLLYVFEIPVLGEDDLVMNSFVPEPVRPPTSPIVTPIPYKDLKNKIKFNFQPTIDFYKDYFVPLLDSDGDTIRFVEANSLRFPDGRIEFGFKNSIDYNGDLAGMQNTDPTIYNKTPSVYEIFRIDKEPYKYEDFKNQLYTTIQAESFIDTLEYNKKYYYIFRQVGENNLKSNPTVVYKIEIVYNSGVYYPIISVHEFKDDAGVVGSKSLKKYLYLTPSYTQTLLNKVEDPSTAPINPSFGVGPTVWDKKYKIRLTSKQTGRKIDINFSMKIGARTILNGATAVLPDNAGKKAAKETRPIGSEETISEKLNSAVVRIVRR